MEAGVPHPNQTAYRKRVSCADRRYLRHTRSDQPIPSGRQQGVHVPVTYKRPLIQ